MKKHLPLFFLLSSLLCAAALLSDVITIPFNTLATKKHLANAKMDLLKRPAAAKAVSYSKQTLHRERLDLGIWQGHNRIDINQPLTNIQKIDFDLANDSELPFQFYLLLNGKNENTGLRISNDRRAPSAAIRFSDIYEVVNDQFFDYVPQNKTVYKISYAPEQGTLKINDLVFALPKRAIAQDEVKLAVWAQNGKPWVDNIDIQLKDGATFTEKFKSEFFWPVLFFVLPLAALAEIAVFRSRRRVAEMLLLNVSLMLGLSAIRETEHYITGFYPRTPESMKAASEWLRYEDDATTELRRLRMKEGALADLKYQEQTARAKSAVLLIGSSQTWGMGADTYEHSFDQRIIATGVIPSNAKLINLAQPGLVSSELLKMLYNYDGPNPAIAVINLGNNDDDEEVLKANLLKMTNFLKQRKARIILVKEANATHERNPALLTNHKALDQIGRELHLPVIDAQAFFDEHASEGIYWWDNVHMTAVGQKRLAEMISKEIKNLVGTN